MRHALLLIAVWAALGCATTPVWERAAMACGVNPMTFAPGAAGYRMPSSNDAANFATIQALVERQTWAIDQSSFDTADKARLGAKTYSVRPPMLATMAAAVYGTLFLFGNTFASEPMRCHWWLVWMTGGLSTALAAWAVARTVDLLAVAEGKPRRGWLAGLSLAFATTALPYGIALNHHGPAAAALALATVRLVQMETGAGGRLQSQSFWFGFLVALAATFDLAGGGIVGGCLVLGQLVGPCRARSAFAATLLGAAVPITVHCALNWSIAGNLTPLLVRADAIAASGSTLRVDELSGIAKQRSPAEMASYLGGLLFDSTSDSHRPRGLLLYVPLAIVAIVAAARGALRRVASLAKARADGQELSQRLGACWLAAGVLLLAYLTTATNNFAGNCYGIRWLVVLLPGIVIVAFDGLGEFGSWGRLAALLATIQGVGFAWRGLLQGPWQPLVMPLWQGGLTAGSLVHWNAAAIALLMLAALATRRR